MATTTPNRENQKQRAQRAKEFKQFRRDYLFSQRKLAEALGCSRRTVVAIEGGESDPRYDLQRRFRDLKQKQERAVA